MRPRFSEDDAYLYHARAAAIQYTPLPSDIAHRLDRLGRLLKRAPNVEEAEWLQAQIDHWTDCPACPPVAVRNTEPIQRSTRRAEAKYRRAGHGPRNASGRARS